MVAAAVIKITSKHIYKTVKATKEKKAENDI